MFTCMNNVPCEVLGSDNGVVVLKTKREYIVGVNYTRTGNHFSWAWGSYLETEEEALKCFDIKRLK